MNYSLETVGTNVIKRDFGNPKLKILFKIKNNLTYQPVDYRGINIVPILIELKKNSEAKSWEDFLRLLNTSIEKSSNTMTKLTKHHCANKEEFSSELHHIESLEDNIHESQTLNNIPEPNSYNPSNEDTCLSICHKLDNLLQEYDDEIVNFKDIDNDFLDEFRSNFIFHFKEALFKDAIKLQNIYEPTITVNENDYYKYAKLLEFENYHTLIKSDKKISTIVSKATNPYYQSLIREIEGYEYANISQETLYEIMRDIDPDIDLSLQKDNTEKWENHFLNIVKKCRLPLFLKTYENELTNGYSEFESNFVINQKILEDALKYTLDNIELIINNLIAQEEQVIKKIHTNRLFLNFKNDYQALMPSITAFWKNSQVLKKYFIDFHNIVDEYKSGRGNEKPFLPAGMCYYEQKIYMNSTNWQNYIQYGKNWSSFSVRNIFLHEIGHAIDYSYHHFNNIIPNKNLRGRFISNNYEFKKFTRMSYKISRKYTIKQYNSIMYYIHPKIKTTPKGVKYEWDTTNKELFAESFSILSNWFINGFDKQDTFIIDSKISNERLKIKTFMPILKYLLKNINWAYLGVNKLHLRQRKTMIKLFLEKIDGLPLILKKAKLKNKTVKLNSYKKPTRNKLIKT